MSMYAEVILPLPLYSTFTYSVPVDMEDKVVHGSRVLVQFGRRNYYTGIVACLHSQAPEGYEVKPLMMVLDSEPVLRYPQLKFWQWISDYYLCSLGDVFKAAVPTGLKPESETYISLNPDYEYNPEFKMTERMAVVVQMLDANKRMKVSAIEHETGLKNLSEVVARLLDAGIILIDERVVDKYRAKKVSMVGLCCEKGDNEAVHGFFDKVSRSAKQERVLIAWLEMSGWMKQDVPAEDVSKNALVEKTGCTPGIIKALVDKGIFRVYIKEINRFAGAVTGHLSAPILTDAQSRARDEIISLWREKNVVLLHGVTGSGKTEIYADLIRKMLEQGSQVLYLVPEISLTTQLTDRLRRIFDDKLLVYHSKFSDNERVDIWKRILSSNDPMLILGVRSSVFLPFARLGLVIVDEEHESTYKQYDPAPRYNARDASIVLASMHGAKVLLGSATPSVETYYKANQGKYGLVSLDKRYSGGRLPSVEVVDMREQRRKKLNRGILSESLVLATRRELDAGNQAIMFQNRRGYAPMVVCGECGWTPKCINCDVSMVYHKSINQLRCHYCGHFINLPDLCPACGQNSVDVFGFGTERIEEDIKKEFSDYRVARMDLDTTRNKDASQEIIEKFSRKETDILVGTQMVSKGLDFGKVTIVGILNADTMLNFPDFRSNERAFNMMEQVAGRAGRRNDNGTVFIQTTDPSNDTIRRVCEHDYQGYFLSELADREKFHYPPFTRVINLYLKNKDRQTVDSVAVAYTMALRKIFGDRVFGPEPPVVGRISTYYLQTIMLKIESNASMVKVKGLLRKIYEEMSADKRMRSTILYYDVDPV